MSKLKKVNKTYSCPISMALDIFGDRWTLLVLRDVILQSKRTYKEVLKANPGIATNVLADRFKRLESRGLLSKIRDTSDARQFVYEPTELGISVIPMLIEMILWGGSHGETKISKAFLKRCKDDRAGVIKEFQENARKRKAESS